MNLHLIYNPAFQMVAAYMIFVAGFLALFAFSILCFGVVWTLHRCAKRLAVLMARSRREQPALESTAPMAFTAPRGAAEQDYCL